MATTSLPSRRRLKTWARSFSTSMGGGTPSQTTSTVNVDVLLDPVEVHAALSDAEGAEVRETLLQGRVFRVGPVHVAKALGVGDGLVAHCGIVSLVAVIKAVKLANGRHRELDHAEGLSIGVPHALRGVERVILAQAIRVVVENNGINLFRGELGDGTPQRVGLQRGTEFW